MPARSLAFAACSSRRVPSTGRRFGDPGDMSRVFRKPLKRYAEFPELPRDWRADQPLLLGVGSEIQHAVINESTDRLPAGIRGGEPDDLQTISFSRRNFSLGGGKSRGLGHWLLLF